MPRLMWKPFLIIGLLFVWSFVSARTACAQSWANGYAHRRVITIDHTKVPNTDQANFPVLISKTFSDLATTANGGSVSNANGYDIIFTSDAAGSSPLAYERETYNATTGGVIDWVNVPTLSHTTDTVIYIFYGNSSVTTDQSNKSSVWDSNFRGVWHLSNGTTLSTNDSTSNGSNGTNYGATATTGQIDGGANFNGSNEYIDVGSLGSFPTQGTIEFWMQPASRSSYPNALTTNYNGGNNGIRFEEDSSGDFGVCIGNGSFNGYGLVSASLQADAWYHIVLTWNTTSSTATGYVSGAQAFTTGSNTLWPSTIANLAIGSGYSTSRMWNGVLDEVRLSTSVRSPDWIATEYNNQSNPSLFTRFGAADAANITSLSQTSGPIGTSITITGTDFGTSQGSSTVTYDGTPGTPTYWSSTQITVPVPSGAAPGDVVVNVSGAPSNGIFFMVPTSWSNGYSYRRAIIIDHTRVPNSDRTNFPLLVSATYPYLSSAATGGGVTNASGYDIIFTSDAAGTIPLPFERESYVASSGAVTFWIQLPTVSHTTDTVIYMFYGNSSVTTDQSNKSGVWDSNFKGVWHLPNGTSLSANDSTSNGNNGTVGGATATSGVINGGAKFAGSSGQKIDVGDSSSVQITGTAITLEAWVNTSESNPSYWERILTKEVTNNASPFFGFALIRCAGTNHVQMGIATSSGNLGVCSASSLAMGNWDHLVGTYDGSHLRIYVNGALDNSLAETGSILGTSQDVVIGTDPFSSGETFNGNVDEVRVSNSVRSADWIATEYTNQAFPSAFYSVGTAYTGSATLDSTLTGISPTSGIVGSSVAITGTDFGTAQGSSAVTFNGTPSSPTSWSPTNIVTTVPSAATSGFVTVSSSGVSSNGLAFTVVPVITNTSATTGSIGGQVGIFGTGFGATQGTSQVMLNGVSIAVDSWTATSIEFTIPTGATSGQLVVSAGTGNNSNSVYFAITGNPLPSGWLDQDVGSVSYLGSATYSNGTFTVNGSGNFGNTSDSLHFVYQGLSGDGTIIARLSGFPSGANPVGGVMIRETLAANSRYVSEFYNANTLYGFELGYRSTPGGGTTDQNGPGMYLPGWVKLVRSGSTFTAYESTDRVNWSQVGSTVTVSMATNVYVGFAVTGGSSSDVTGTFDNISIDTPTTPAPVITSLSATTGSVGCQVTISGLHFGVTQGKSIVTLNSSAMVINSWTDTSISIALTASASSGSVIVSVAPSMNDSNPVYFTVTGNPLPPGWLDQDIGNVGAMGSATYLSGTFTVNGAGVMSTTDAFHFVYQPLSGDGTIVARVVSTPSNEFTAVMIRETMNSNSTFASTDYTPYSFKMLYRSTTGGSDSIQSQSSGPSPNPPYWLKLTRSGNSFTSYESVDGVSWGQIGSSVTISMATNVYIGLAVDSSTTGTLQTTTFDNVSVSSAANPAPTISSVSATTGSIGSQVTISGTNFGTTQGSSLVVLNGLSMTVNSWSSTSITATIATGASSGYLVISVAPSMNNSNPVYFTVTTNPLPSGWLDLDIGSGGATGSAGYSSGTFTLQGAGVMTTTDAFHFAYQTLAGDGAIVARVVSTPNSGYAAVMIRETTNSNSTFASTSYSFSAGQFSMSYRATTGGSPGGQSGGSSATPPYWLKVTRSGNSFSSYFSLDGTFWSQIGSTVTISMASSVYIGLAVDSGATGTLQTSTFDNVSVTAGTPYPTPVITSISPTSGGIGSSVTINGSNFGASQGSASVNFNGTPATSVTSWSNTQIVAVVPSGASTGPVTVLANGIGSNKNYVFTLINPVITSLSPPFGPVGGAIVIYGSGFGSTYSGNPIKFNGLSGGFNNITWSDTAVTAYVPTGATSGPVTVTVSGVTSNGAAFTVIEADSVSGISPTSGPIGTTVVISGTGFGPTQNDSVVSFYGGSTPTITNWSDTSITATVPSGSITGPVSVTVAGVTAAGPVFTRTTSAVLTDSLGNTTSYAAEIVGGQWKSTDTQGSGCSTCTVRGVVHNSFDARGNTLTTTDPAGNTTTYTYDSSNNLLSESHQLNPTTTATTSYTYNSLGEVLTVTDPLGNVTTNTYDSHGNLLTVTSPKPNSNTAASVTTFAYNSLGELTTITDPLGHVTTMTYTTAGLVATIKDAQNNVTTYGYDAKGNRTSVTDALNHQTTFTYDAMSRLTQITYPDTTTSGFTYDNRGRRTSVTDQNGKTTSYAYDDADRLTSVTDAAQHATTYAYDTEDNLTSITDANSNQTAFAYDAFGRVTKTTFPSALAETYQYDADNNLTQKTDRKGQTIQYLYDALNRLTQKTYPDTTNVEYTYDLVGKVLQVNDPTGTYAFAYDNMGRLIGTTSSYSFLTSRNFTNAYTYDAASNRTGFTDPEGGSTTYAYDTLNRLTSLAPPSAFGSGSFGFSYDALSRRTQMTRPNSVTTNYSYDNLSRLTSVLHQLSGSTIDGATYTLDNAGNRTSKTDQLAAVTSNYTYDTIYQLTQVTQANNTTESYSYDAVGNRTASLGVSSYTTNASNELTATSNASYTYDSNGNTLTKTDSSGTTNYAWDFENRLASVTLPGSGGAVTFKYDPLGHRVYKSSSSGTSNFVYDGDDVIEETNSTGTAVARYSGTKNIDEPLAMFRSGVTTFYNADGLGSITSMDSNSGAVAQTYTYDSFGRLTGSSGSLTNPFQYTARESDPETGLYYYRARYYAPSAGRFVSEDPIQSEGGINFYVYAGNNSANFGDGTGLCPSPKCFAQLYYRPVDVDGVDIGANHSFWWVRGSDGVDHIISAGPSGTYGGWLNVSVSKNRRSGKYPKDDDPSKATLWWNSGISSDFCFGVDMMVITADGWPNDSIAYLFAPGPNSNTAARILGEAGGFHPGSPPNAVGWGFRWTFYF